jgi:hypothetical protein
VRLESRSCRHGHASLKASRRERLIQAGYIGAGPEISIRGGDYDQIGYEIDGVPVNRAFDNYPSGTASSLGQQELQVYTGAAPANAEAQGLSGFINQVIKTGTYPASTTITGDLGGPMYYHKFSIETGGASENRNFPIRWASAVTIRTFVRATSSTAKA